MFFIATLYACRPAENAPPPGTGPKPPGCESGSAWDGKQCVREVVVSVQAECPAGTTWDGAQCSLEGDKPCPAGTHREGGDCAKDVEADTTVGPSGCPSGMVFIPGGRFSMGTNDGDPDERPVHSVDVASFCLDMTEVTAAAYATCVQKGQCDTDKLSCDAAATYGVSGKESHPVTCVNWNQSVRYCAAQGARLPTEEEWEYAARSGKEARKFPWGSTTPTQELCWSGVSQRHGTCPVDEFTGDVNRWGVVGLSGNISEWTSSLYNNDYSQERSDPRRVIRGGGWGSQGLSSPRGAFRLPTHENEHDDIFGFRCAKNPVAVAKSEKTP